MVPTRIHTAPTTHLQVRSAGQVPTQGQLLQCRPQRGHRLRQRQGHSHCLPQPLLQGSRTPESEGPVVRAGGTQGLANHPASSAPSRQTQGGAHRETGL